MAPVIHECRRRADAVEPLICLTGQHREMLNQVTQYFEIEEDYHLDLMVADQTLAELTARCVEGLDGIIAARQPHCVVAQGDTTTVMAASLAAFYRHVPFVHVEAGLRTGNLRAPWPEELNRRIADISASLCCAPTRRAVDALLAERIEPAAIRLTGNTIVDALQTTLRREQDRTRCRQEKYAVLTDRRMVLITGHRRENFGQRLEQICRAIAALADRFPDCHFVYPVHLNPNVQRPVHGLLSGRDNVHLVPPVGYPEFVWLMARSTLILTDSGGVQEEAPTLKKPVLIMRDTTERPEAIEAGAARLVGTLPENIIAETTLLLTDPVEYAACQIDHSPYGDGHSAERIVDWMLEQTWHKTRNGIKAAAGIL